MPRDYADYTRGHPPLAVFPNKAAIPGIRLAAGCAGAGLPCFDPANAAGSAEVFAEASPRDTFGTMCTPGGRGAAGHYFYNVWEPELVPFLVELGTPGRKDAAVVIAPGGGPFTLSWEPEGVAQAQWLNSLGISAFVLKYRVPDSDVSLLDAQRAVSLIRSRANKYQLNASRVGFMGSGSGGNVGIRLATSMYRSYSRIDAIDDAKFRPDFLLLLYPSIPLMTGQLMLSLLPPTYLAFSEDDPCSPAANAHSFQYAARLSTVSHLSVFSFPDGRHGWADPNYYPSVKDSSSSRWRSLAENWLWRLGVL